MLLVLFLLHLSPSFSPSNVRSRRFLQSGRWHSLLRLCRSDFVFGRLVTCEFVFVMCPCFLLYFLCVVASLQQRPQGCSNYFRDISVAGASPIGLPPSLENKDAGSASVIPSDNDVCLRKAEFVEGKHVKPKRVFICFRLCSDTRTNSESTENSQRLQQPHRNRELVSSALRFVIFSFACRFAIFSTGMENVFWILIIKGNISALFRVIVFLTRTTHRSSLRLLKTKCMNKIVG